MTYPGTGQPMTAGVLADGSTINHLTEHGRTAGVWENVVHYGADPIGGLDSSTGIRAALAAASGGTLFFPRGVYRVTLAGRIFPVGFGNGTLYQDSGIIAAVPSNTRIVGEPGAVIKMEGVPNSTAIPNSHYTIFAMGGGESNISFEGLTFRGENNPFVFYQNGPSAPIRIYNSSTVTDVTVRRCRFEYLYGFAIQAAQSAATERVNVIDCDFISTGNGPNVNADFSIQTGNRFYQSRGIEASGAYTNISNNTFELCPLGSAIAIGGRTAADSIGAVRGVVVSGNVINGCDTNSGLTVADGIRGASIVGNTFTRCDGGAINMTSSTGYPPSDCFFGANVIYGNCKIGTATAAVILSQGGRHTFSGNRVFDETSSASYWQKVGVEVFGTGHYIAGNSISTTDRFGASSCITMENASTALIGDNFLDAPNGVIWNGTAAPLTQLVQTANSTDQLLDFRVDGEQPAAQTTRARLSFVADGTMKWGDGSNVVDTTLARSAANVLSLGADDAVKTGAAVHGSLPSPASYAAGAQFYCTTDKKPVWSDGASHWVDAAGANHT